MQYSYSPEAKDIRAKAKDRGEYYTIVRYCDIHKSFLMNVTDIQGRLLPRVLKLFVEKRHLGVYFK